MRQRAGADDIGDQSLLVQCRKVPVVPAGIEPLVV